MKHLLLLMTIACAMTSCATVKITKDGKTTKKTYKLENLDIQIIEDGIIINKDTIKYDTNAIHDGQGCP